MHPFAGAHAWGATSHFGRMTAHLGVAQTGCGGGMRLPAGEGVSCRLVRDSGGHRDLFTCLTMGVCSIAVGL